MQNLNLAPKEMSK